MVRRDWTQTSSGRHGVFVGFFLLFALLPRMQSSSLAGRVVWHPSSAACSPPSPICIRGSPGTPGPGKDTLYKFAPTDPQSASIEACCGAASSVVGTLAVQLVQKEQQEQPACWLMGQTQASITTNNTCTSALVPTPAPPPTPVPRRKG